jgi:oxygen-independent coproporphyrinogen-3 oxidase
MPEGGFATPLVVAEARASKPVPRYTSYPTAAQFTPSVTAATYGDWLAAIPADTPLSLYLHVPFCDTLCWFCGCHTKVTRKYAPIADYVEVVLKEIDTVAARLGGPMRVRHVHWGGGTPTVLSPDDIQRVDNRLRSVFAYEPDAEFAVEVDPRELPLETIRTLAAVGVNRVSVGVQDLNREVQVAINRRHGLELVRGVVDALRDVGINRLNIDLMYGLPHQTVGRVLETVAGVLSLAPERMSLFGYAHVPWMKPHQKVIDAVALPDSPQRLAQLHAAIEMIARAGYVPIGLDHFALPGDPLAEAAAAGRLRRNFQGYTTDDAPALIGFGASAIGSLPQGYVQNQPDLARHAATVRAGDLPTVRGVALTDDDRVRAAAIERLMCDMRVDLDAVCAAFATTPAIAFPDLDARLAESIEEGVAVRTGNVITVAEAARPFLRLAAAAFDVYWDPAAVRHAKAV